MQAMGSNLTYQAARTAAKCVGIVDCLQRNFGRDTSGNHGESKTEKYLNDMVGQLHEAQVMRRIPWREHSTFPNFAMDLLNDVDMVQVNTWLKSQKVKSHLEMQI